MDGRKQSRCSSEPSGGQAGIADALGIVTSMREASLGSDAGTNSLDGSCEGVAEAGIAVSSAQAAGGLASQASAGNASGAGAGIDGDWRLAQEMSGDDGWSTVKTRSGKSSKSSKSGSKSWQSPGRPSSGGDRYSRAGVQHNGYRDDSGGGGAAAYGTASDRGSAAVPRFKAKPTYAHSKKKTPLADDTALMSRRLNVHDDDIHGLIVLPEGGKQVLVSGSKDCTVKKFSAGGAFVCDLIAKPKKASYARWATALAGFSDHSMVVGFRNGWLNCLDTTGAMYHSGMAEVRAAAGDGAKERKKKGCYKVRNQLRITGVKCLEDYTALIGVTDHILHYDFTNQCVLGEYVLDQPEWVYGFERMGSGAVVYIHAGSLSLFDVESMSRIDSLVVEPRVKPGEKRMHISAVKQFEGTNLCALSCFTGVTRVLDVPTKKIVHESREHCTGIPEKERVWQAIPVPGSSHNFASCADDATVKLWDIRAPASIRTIAGHPGRVSSMCFLNENSLVAGTCPDDVHSDPDKAQFCFYDLRK